MLEGMLVIRNPHPGSGGTVQLPSVRLTETVGERMRGLLGRPPLNPGQALWIQPCNSVHSFFMGYPIDVVYLDREQRVCKCLNEMVPWRISVSWQARSVVEVAAGQIHTLGIEVGQRFEWLEN